MTTEVPSVLFVGSAYAGHASRFATLQTTSERDPRFRAAYRIVRGWDESGWIERMRPLPPGIRGRLRGVWSARSIAAWPRPDVIWCAASEVTLPWLWSQAGPFRRPLIRDLDATGDQIEEMAHHYWKRDPRTGIRRHVSQAIERAIWRQVTMFTPWSRWAADGLRAAGVPDERIRIVPPGVDLAFWRTDPRTAPIDRPVRLLFVGGDFERKGGTLLIDALRDRDPRDFTLDVVTRDRAPIAAENVRIHRAEAGSDALRQLYQQADVFVLPTQAECFGIAAVEALAAGLPVVMGNVGGAPDIVDPLVNGWLIEPNHAGISDALDSVLLARADLPGMGQRAREKAESCFDARRNTARVLDLVLEQAHKCHAKRH